MNHIRKHRWFLLVLTFTMFTLLLGGCGGDEADESAHSNIESSETNKTDIQGDTSEKSLTEASSPTKTEVSAEEKKEIPECIAELEGCYSIDDMEGHYYMARISEGKLIFELENGMPARDEEIELVEVTDGEVYFHFLGSDYRIMKFDTGFHFFRINGTSAPKTLFFNGLDKAVYDQSLEVAVAQARAAEEVLKADEDAAREREQLEKDAIKKAEEEARKAEEEAKKAEEERKKKEEEAKAAAEKEKEEKIKSLGTVYKSGHCVGAYGFTDVAEFDLALYGGPSSGTAVVTQNGSQYIMNWDTLYGGEFFIYSWDCNQFDHLILFASGDGFAYYSDYTAFMQ